jgi:hypothetical protein
MKVRGVFVAAALASAAIAGCGSSGDHTPALASLPLLSGANVLVAQRTCDRGANAFCALQLVVVGAHYRNSVQMVRAERRVLRRHHWSHADAPVGLEVAADSPGDRLRVTYATASNDLEGADLGWIKRVQPVTLALSHEIFARRPALSMLLVLGTG